MTSDIAVDPAEIETRRQERTWRLAALELPLLRVAGSVLLSFAVWLHNRYVVPAPIDEWAVTTIVLTAWAAVAWVAIVYFLRRPRAIDLTLPALAGDLVVWTFAIAHSGAERSWLFFILLLRVADQVQTTFRRALAFALFATACYATLLAWVVVVEERNIAPASTSAKLLFILFAGIYIALAARTAEHRRARLTDAVRTSRELIRKLEEAHARAEEASAAKSEFVANMSHEMRTPLQSVIGMLHLAIEDEPSESRSRRLETARRAAQTLLAMIDDVLDFSRIEARRLELEPVYFSLRQMLADTMKTIGVIAATKGLTLSYGVNSDVPETVWGDAGRLRQILVNLIGNAIKFTHEGEIAVYVSRNGREVRFDVRDTGVGIAPAVRQKIFEPFVQADSSYARRYGGAGLGLSIVARLLDAMGGTVDVSSRQGSGSVFSFTVPLTADAVGAAPQRKSWESTLAGRSVLVIEQGELARATIADILRSRGIFASAFARAADAPNGRFACAVTADPAIPVQPQVVITSPLDQHSYPFRVTRPVGERELIDAVGAALGLTSETIEYTLEPVPRAASPAIVLLVDDNDVNREVLSEMLRRLGHRVVTANDGEEALAALSEINFDVAFMDVQLPGIDGLEATRRYRARGGSTPVIALTAHTSREDRDRCLAAGMLSVLTKPVDAAQLATAIETVTRRVSIADVAGGNPALLARVRDAFARQTPELLAAMREAIGAGDADALARHAHKLKGSLSHFPGPAHGIARDVEAAAKNGDVDTAARAMPMLERGVAEISDELAKAVQ